MTDTSGTTGAPAGAASADQLAAVQAALNGEPAPVAVVTPPVVAPAPVAVPAPAPVATPAPAAPAAPAPAATPTPAATTDPQAVDMTGWPPEAVEAYTRRDKDARKYQTEAGDRRIASKDVMTGFRAIAEQLGVELPPDPTAAPEPAAVTERARTLAFDAALAHAALTHNVPAAQLDYLAFKLSRNAEAQALDPTSAEYRATLGNIALSEIQRDASLLGSGTQQQVASVQDLGGAQGNAALTLDAFQRMSPLARGELYTTDKPSYDRLVAEEAAAARR